MQHAARVILKTAGSCLQIYWFEPKLYLWFVESIVPTGRLIDVLVWRGILSTQLLDCAREIEITATIIRTIWVIVKRFYCFPTQDWWHQKVISLKVFQLQFETSRHAISCNSLVRLLEALHMLPYHSMMASSNGNIFLVTDHLCGEFTGHRCISRTKASDAELWCFLWSAPE